MTQTRNVLRGIAVIGLFVLATTVAGNAAAENTKPTQQQISANYGRLPLSFEANQGQTAGPVKFLSRGSGYNLFLTSTEAVLVLSNSKPVVLRMKLVGANPQPQVAGVEKLPGTSHYFIGKDPEQWRTNIPTYTKVHYVGVYPGIDLLYYGNQRQLEYDFVVAPGADPKAITLAFAGARKLDIDSHGDLVIRTADGEVRMQKPVIYQDQNGSRSLIAGRYVRRGSQQIGFQVAGYDRSRPLIIDPVLVYSTYLGGSGEDRGSGIAVDGFGQTYVTGSTGSSNFPVTAGAFQTSPPGGFGDVFVTKLNAAGTALVYSTYLGGSYPEQSGGIAVDDSGQAYVTGYTNSFNFPITVGAYQPTLGSSGGPSGGSNAFVTKLSANGAALIYSTYLGGPDANSDDQGWDIAVDSSGQAYVTGLTRSANFPVTAGAFQPSVGSVTPFGVPNDVFVTKLNVTGTALVYSTYLGGLGGDQAFGIAVDGSGQAYVTGLTHSSNFPVTVGAFQTLGQFDAFVTKLNATGTALVYSTYLGGSIGTEQGHGIAVDGLGQAYVTGLTNSSNFPVTAGAFQPSLGGSGGPSDAYVTKLNATGSALVYSTYLGGSSGDVGGSIAVDSFGQAYVMGYTNSSNYPVTAGAFQTSLGGGYDTFVTKLNTTGTALLYSTYLGGIRFDFSGGITVDSSGQAYALGSTQSSNFPVTAGAFQPSLGSTGQFDAFVAKISFNQPPVANAGTDQTVSAGADCLALVTLNATASSDPNGDTLTFTWTGAAAATGATPTVTLPLGTHTITLTVDDGNGGTHSDTVVITVIDSTGPRIDALTASPSSLWPPNHKMVAVTISGIVADNCGGAIACQIVSISSNEPVDGLGDGDTAPDWQITGTLSANLRAERSGTGSGRVYTITVECTDAAGNSTTKTVIVTVAHDSR